MRAMTAAVVLAGLSACAAVIPIPLKAAAPAPAAGAAMPTAEIRDAAGAVKGTAMAHPMGDAMHVEVKVSGMAPGTYAAHIHTVGLCEGPKFTTAGPHWNPAGKAHGKDNPAGAHAGDLPNITVGADGTGRTMAHVMGVTLAQLMDADGASVIVHAGPDDYKSDPTGNSGDRIACGVLK